MYIYNLFLYFFIYAYLGWIVEVAFQGVVFGQLVNRGFLNGPVCPIYGVGMDIILILLTPVQHNFILLFVFAIILASMLELFVGWLLDKMFHMRWWDYSNYPFNINGYVCLSFSLMWGMGALIMVRVVHPVIARLVDEIPLYLGIVMIVTCVILMIMDLIVTYKEVIGISRSLGEAEKITATLKEVSEKLTKTVGTTAIAATNKAYEYIPEIEEINLQEKKEELERKYAELMEKLQHQTTRFGSAFPNWHRSNQKKLMTEHIKNLVSKIKKTDLF